MGGLAACGKKNPSAHAVYNCEGGVTLDVVFTGGQEVEIAVRDKAYKLGRVEYESGAKYEGGPISFISMGVSAKFTEKGRSIQCRRD
ncbi:MAG: Membrane-bound lysozyme-inhibitor of c-type lysozyme [Micavibrio sp.]|nr:Membrane-bound lysozyme-inhibitor of c-type lysozyme [Micavibrio sp.]